MGKDEEGSGFGLFQGTRPEFAWTDSNSVKLYGISTMICSGIKVRTVTT
jgi:hypothetical protein